MIDLNLFIGLVTFYFVMYVTPGPNNAMVLTSGIKFGFSKTIPRMILFVIYGGVNFQLVTYYY